ncbi:MAG: ATP-binding protein [Acetobacteraceae bacterium]
MAEENPVRPDEAPAPRRPWHAGVRLHHLLFLAFTLVAAVPVLVLAVWEGNTAFQNELDSVRERHLLVARNLTSALTRYVKDVKAAFSLAFESGALSHPVAGLPELLISLNLEHICIIGPDGKVEAVMPGLPDRMKQRVDADLLASLKALIPPGSTSPQLSQIRHHANGQPVLFLVKPLPEGRVGLGILSTSYLLSLQQAIAFGDNGHAVITDAGGQVIAHPFKDWVAASRDISGVSVVAAMKRGETGVGRFYSPAFKDDMIAGFAVVPDTGWGVMVPQPVSELRRRAGEVKEMAIVIAVASFIAAALMSWLIALFLARPVQAVAATAQSVLDGNDKVSVPEFAGWVPREIRRLGQAFNTMLRGLRRQAAETREALRQAEMSNEAKTQFLANMSHEIRTPLNGVVGMIELMHLTDLTPQQRQYVEQAAQSSQALLRLIDDILDLSKIEVGRMELEPAPFHLPSLLHDARTLFADLARDKSLSLTVSLPDQLNVMLVGDAHRLLQILTNLLGNAIKFTAEGGVTLRAEPLEETDTALRLRFEVIDTGIGVPTSKQDVIFNAFSQADSSMTRRYGGTGLGLSIARQLCRMMGGEIGVESTVGAGSTFWFTVPLEKALGQALPVAPPVAPPRPPGRTAPPVAPAMPPQPARPAFVSAASQDFQQALSRVGRSAVHILLVEDNAANMRVTQALLETLGCAVTPARNGLEAVAAYRADRFDLVLMDCQMPEMDGYEATRTIRQLEAFQGYTTPIVALTAHAMAGSREASLASGMNDQLTKPLTLAALTEKLLEWLTPAEAASGQGA